MDKLVLMMFGGREGEGRGVHFFPLFCRIPFVSWFVGKAGYE